MWERYCTQELFGAAFGTFGGYETTFRILLPIFKAKVTEQRVLRKLKNSCFPDKLIFPLAFNLYDSKNKDPDKFIHTILNNKITGLNLNLKLFCEETLDYSAF